MKKQFLLAAAFAFIWSACARINLYERVVPMPGQMWQSSFKPQFDFDIKDTAAPLQIFLILRHDNRYNYNNLWINLYRHAPGSDTSKVPYELKLATNEHGWLGTGMDDIYEHRIPLSPPAGDSFYFNRSGQYSFAVEQIMREDPLQHVYNVGLRIERKN